MPFQIYDFVNSDGLNEFREWTSDLQKPQRAKLNEKIDKLMLYGDLLHPEMLTGTSIAGIKKLRCRGKVQLRPLLCNGPINIFLEYTMLMGAKEIGDKWVPKGAPSSANNKKTEVINDPINRRIEHEEVL